MTMALFDRRAVRAHRDRASRGLDAHGFLIDDVAGRLLDRLDDVTRRFPAALDLGCRDGRIGRRLDGRGGVETLIEGDLSPRMAALAGPRALACDEEALPFAEATFDLVLSCLSLHWVNDLPGALVQIRRALKPDGLFLGALFGAGTLRELRDALYVAEEETAGGVGPRVSPFADLRDLGNLLTRAGFALPVADADRITVSYPDPLTLMADLRGMGESNAVSERRRGLTPPATLAAARRHYADRHGGPDGRVPATFQVVFLAGWAPHRSQQQPAARGSGRVSLTEVFE